MLVICCSRVLNVLIHNPNVVRKTLFSTDIILKVKCPGFQSHGEGLDLSRIEKDSNHIAKVRIILPRIYQNLIMFSLIFRYLENNVMVY